MALAHVARRPPQLVRVTRRNPQWPPQAAACRTCVRLHAPRNNTGVSWLGWSRVPAFHVKRPGSHWSTRGKRGLREAARFSPDRVDRRRQRHVPDPPRSRRIEHRLEAQARLRETVSGWPASERPAPRPALEAQRSDHEMAVWFRALGIRLDVTTILEVLVNDLALRGAHRVQRHRTGRAQGVARGLISLAL